MKKRRMFLFTLGLFCFVSGTQMLRADCVAIPPGAIGWWRAEDNGDDSIGHNTAILSGTVFTNGEVGRAFSFNGINDTAYVSASVFASISNNFTMEMWVFPTDMRGATAETVDFQTGIGTQQKYAVFPSHGDNSFGPGQAGAGISVGTNGVTVFEHAAFYIPSPLVYNAAIIGWNHVVVVYTNNQCALYLNGAWVRTGLASPKIVHPSAEMGGGAYGNLAGFMDEYTVYDRALSAAEVQAIFLAGSAGKCLPPTLQISALPGAVQLRWPTNASGFLLETNSTLTPPIAWGVLASNYSVVATNFTVTNSVSSSARFFRLRKP